MQFIFLLSTSGRAEPLDTSAGTLGFCGTPVEKHCHTGSHSVICVRGIDGWMDIIVIVGCEEIISSTWFGSEADGPSFEGDG